MSKPELKTPRARRPRTVAERLRYSKHFIKEDRSLDDYIDRNQVLNRGEKQLLRKLLKLRKQEDSNTVKVTSSGLSKLLAVNIKTIRRNLNGLINKGFISYETDVVDKGCNYAKRVYSFPDTFPGFDLRTVFTNKGAKKKFVRRHGPVSKANNRAHCGTGVGRKTGGFTCPILTSLSDSSSIRRTCSNTERQPNGCLPEITTVRTHASAAPSRECETKPVVRTKCQLNFHSKALQGQILAGLRHHKLQGKSRYVSRFFNKLCNERDLSTADRHEIAENLAFMMFPNVVEGICDAKNPLKRLFADLRDAVESFVPDTVEEEAPISIRVVPAGWIPPVARVGARMAVSDLGSEQLNTTATVANRIMAAAIRPLLSTRNLSAAKAQAPASVSALATAPATHKSRVGTPLPGIGLWSATQLTQAFTGSTACRVPQAPASVN